MSRPITKRAASGMHTGDKNQTIVFGHDLEWDVLEGLMAGPLYKTAELRILIASAYPDLGHLGCREAAHRLVNRMRDRGTFKFNHKTDHWERC